MASRPERGGNASASEHVMTCQDCRKVEHVKTSLLESCKSSHSFSQCFSIDFFSSHASYKFLVYLGPCVAVGCFLEQKLKFLIFGRNSSNDLLGETHVYIRFFIFDMLFCNHGASILHMHAVFLRKSLAKAQTAKRTQKLNT